MDKSRLLHWQKEKRNLFMEENTRERRRPIQLLTHIDLGTVIFLIILVYILISVVVYAVSRKTEVVEVRMGTLSENAYYRGIALREEKLIKSRFTGTVNYYNEEGDRVRVGGLAYSVDENGEIADYADPNMLAGDYYTSEDLASFRGQVISFISDFDPAKYYTVYDFKSASSSKAQKITNRAILSGITNLKSTSLHTVRAQENGSIVYSYDNYNGRTFDSLTREDFDRSTCKKTQLENGKKVQEGKPVCRIVTDENWSVAIYVPNAETAKRMKAEKYVEVRFLKNNYTSWAFVEKKDAGDGGCFVNLRFSNSMETFCMDRFVDIEILSNEMKGLKVPTTSITSGDFFLVPKEYVFTGSNGQQGVLLRVYTTGGNSGTRFVPAVPYSETDDEYYLDNSVLKDGMILERPNSSDQFMLGRKEKLIGVYYINKGYPDFRQVTVTMQNSEYSIVKPNEIYGLQEYDYIVLHADSIRFNNY
ncbi:MAG: HlyD family efflux transporter periplasmic adaptor subunit [Eubacteriales bacterium]|nr:HlyD family efflux transporter periplasmic adaptor subunit [Eubacteriales bacterium]